MKAIKVLSLGMVLLMFSVLLISCEKETKLENYSTEIEDVSLLCDENNEPVLAFHSEREMFEQIVELKKMSEEDLQKWYSSKKKFVSQYNFKWIVADELFEVADSKEKMNAIREKYRNILIFNYNDEDLDYSPYTKSTGGVEFVCNKYGNIMINGEIRNFNTLNSYEETEYYETLQYTEKRNNTKCQNHDDFITGFNVLSDDGKRKLVVDIRRCFIYNGYEVKLHAQKKVWGVWHAYKTVYNIRFTTFYPASNWIYEKYENTTNGIFSYAIQKFLNNDNGFVSTDNEIPSGTYHYLVQGVRDRSIYSRLTLHISSRGVPNGSTISFTTFQLQ